MKKAGFKNPVFLYMRDGTPERRALRLMSRTFFYFKNSKINKK